MFPVKRSVLFAAGVLAGLLAVSLLASVTARAAPASPSETREDEHFASRALGRDLAYALYLPPGYGASDARYPVLYLLHGVDGNHREWLEEGHVQQSLDVLIKSGLAAPMIVVMPDGANSWYVDSKDVGGPGDYATAIADELTAHIDAVFRTRASPRYRGIGGLSMGGFGALRLAFEQPFRYVAAASFSGAFWARIKPDSQLGSFTDRIFTGAFGQPFDAKRFLALSPLTTVDTLVKAKDPPAVFLSVGDRDRYKLYADTFQLFMHMRDLGLPVDMRMTGGDHDWGTWSDELRDALLFFDARFRGGE
jgi:enterochelin esterase family protein